MNRTLGKRQQQILDYIRHTFEEKGYPPTVREICKAVGLKSTSTVHVHLSNLEKKGYIRKDPPKRRCIELVNTTLKNKSQYMKKSVIQASKDNSSFGIKKGDYVLLTKRVSHKTGNIVAVGNKDSISFKLYADSDRNILGVVEGVFKKL